MKIITFIILTLVFLLPHGIQAQQTPCPAMPAGMTAPAAGQMQTQNQPGPQQGMMKGDMMQMCAPMMDQMKRHSLIISEMLQVMKEIARVEQTLARGISAGERNIVISDLDQKIQRLDRMMNEMRAGMIMQSPQKPSGGPGEAAPSAPPQAPSSHAH